jgi:hypothetical protein
MPKPFTDPIVTALRALGVMFANPPPGGTDLAGVNFDGLGVPTSMQAPDGSIVAFPGAGGASLATANAWQKAQSSVITPLAYAASIALDGAAVSNQINVAALTGNLILANPVNFTNAVTLNIWLTQDAAGNRLLTLGNKIKTAGGLGITLSAAANAVDFLSLVYNPTKDIWVASILNGVA